MKNFSITASTLIIATSTLFGCASVPTTSTEKSTLAKQMSAPSEGKAGLYIYRSNTVVGGALKKDIWVDGECVGESARGTFFHIEVDGDQTHTLATESEFSPNLLEVKTESGQNYFVEQTIKMGVFVGGANLKLMHPTQGQQDIQKLSMAETGKCSKAFPKKDS
ncbi:Protein of unknown function [Acinetobacter marinus]|uniref:DUF2846 domain-containing protein n=1 Tax=Acinetobacter marinus TaxID=281375 RepID=A0A1G6GT87_9GAMM|nr:DUF2846 domain-containing protein [Acinetobacter marinus]SDB85207.1 Protein of unknown function [Acinetobacter marinus]